MAVVGLGASTLLSPSSLPPNPAPSVLLPPTHSAFVQLALISDQHPYHRPALPFPPSGSVATGATVTMAAAYTEGCVLHHMNAIARFASCFEGPVERPVCPGRFSILIYCFHRHKTLENSRHLFKSSFQDMSKSCGDQHLELHRKKNIDRDSQNQGECD